MRVRVEVLDHELPVVGGHLAIMLPGDGIGRPFRASFVHFGFLPENRCIGHGSLLFARDNYVLVAPAQRTAARVDFTIE
jgi:hypothetical protein